MSLSREWPLPSELSVVELRVQAEMYAEMAATTRDGQIAASLLRLAERFARLAREREERKEAPGG